MRRMLDRTHGKGSVPLDRHPAAVRHHRPAASSRSASEGCSRSMPYLPAANFFFVAAGAAAWGIVAKPAERKAIEAQVSFFRLESDALRAAAGLAGDPSTEDCVLQGAASAVTYVCPAPTDSRERVKAALVERGWLSPGKSHRDPRCKQAEDEPRRIARVGRDAFGIRRRRRGEPCAHEHL